MYNKPQKEKLSDKTGYLYSVYVEIAHAARDLRRIAKHMTKNKPWFDRIEK